MNHFPIPAITRTSASAEELAVYRALKPYLARCLRLNHDVNNALAGIIGYTDFLLEGGSVLTEDQRRFLSQIMQAAEKVRRLGEELCDEKVAAAQSIDLAALSRALEQMENDSD